ncbi:MAG: SDR family oxidoreductase [candidate division NC10 bacterium]|nr:SDR family oxidoreductase [candidate division NC10 bacterium]
MLLAGRVGLISGAGSGLGRSTALLFAQEGAAVVVADIAEDRGLETVSMIRENGNRAVAVSGDVSRERDTQQMVAMAITTFGRLDILANYAGISHDVPLTEINDEAFYRVMDTNLKGVLFLAKHAIPKMVASGGGSIINIGSAVALRARQNMPLYVASKGAVVAVTRSMALDYAADNIRVNCICPTATETPMIRARYASMRDGEKVFQDNLATIPMGRLGRPEDIANVALFLACDLSAYVTGHTLIVDGGSLAGTKAL